MEASSAPNSYDGVFTRAYDRHFSHYSQQAGLRILEFYLSHPCAKPDASILDLGCGSGQLASLFLRAGCSVVGIDSSDVMLDIARANNAPIPTGKQVFLKADIKTFKINSQFALVTSTYNTLNHLQSEDDLATCFRRVYEHLLKPGLFLFDLHTYRGLTAWDGTERQSNDRISYIGKGIFDPKTGRAEMKLEGAIVNDQGTKEPFQQTLTNQAFDLKRVEALLRSIGFTRVYFALVEDLGSPLPDPEKFARVFGVAEK